jgi:hypothetical protein
MWCTTNNRRFTDLKFDLVDYNELSNAVNAGRRAFREIGYRGLLIPDELWEDAECKPKIVHHLIVGVETREMLAQMRANQIAYRMVEAPHSVI